MTFETFSSHAFELRGRRRRESHGGTPELILLSVVDSTNRLAARIVRDFAREEGAPPAVDLVAFSQAAGRGRDGRSWSSPPGAGVYATAIRTVPIARLQLVPLVTGVALAQTLNRRLDGRCRLKWPNDLVVDGRKLGGILVEAASRGETTAAVLVGFGVNVAADVATLAAPAPTSVERESGRAVPLAPLCEDLLAAVDAGLAADEPSHQVVARYRALSAHRAGDRLVCRVGGEVLEGTFRDLDEHGFLRLEVAGGERRLAAGEVIG